MKIRRVTLIVAIVVLIVLVLSTRWSIPWLLSLLPAPSEKKDFVQSLEAVVNIVFLIASLLLSLLAFVFPREASNAVPIPGAAPTPLTNVKLNELQQRLGQRGGQVDWINRRAVQVSDLRAYGRIVIIGKMKIGKTREAIELIRSAIQNELISENRIFEPSSAMASLNRGLILQVSSQVGGNEPILLFLDDVPYHFTAHSLDLIETLLDSLEKCKAEFVVATARSDQITQSQRDWFRDRGFHAIYLPALDEAQTASLIDSASEIFGLRIEDAARNIVLERRDGTPECTILSFRRLRAEGIVQVGEIDATRVSGESLSDAWASAKRYIQKECPGAEHVLEAISTFHAAKILKITDLVLDYASHLLNRTGPRIKPDRHEVVKRALVYLGNFDIGSNALESTELEIISAPDVISEGTMEPVAARKLLGEFFLKRRRGLLTSLLDKLDRDLIPLDAVVLMLLTHAAYDNGAYEEALEYANAGIMLTHKSDWLYMMRVLIYIELKRIPEAISDTSQVIKLHPEGADLYKLRATLYNLTNNLPAAIEDYSKAIQLEASNGSLYRSRGDLHKELKDYREALLDYSKAINLGHSDAATYHNRGQMHAELEDHQAAITDYSHAIELHPQNVAYYVSRATSYFLTDDLENEIKDYSRLVELEPDQADWYYYRGDTNLKLGHKEAALSDFRRAKDLDPSNDALPYEVAQALAEHELDGVCDWLELAIQLNAENRGKAKEDPAFRPMQNEPRFRRLVDEDSARA